MTEDEDLDDLLRATGGLLRSTADSQFETECERMERRLREDERRVQRQRRRVYSLRAKGADSTLAEDLLHVFEDLLAQRRVMLMRLKEGRDKRYTGA